MPHFFITTAIAYVNGRPHLGHAYERILADVLARYHRSRGDEVFFLTGVDEHGQKVQQAAQKQKTAPQAFCDEMTEYFQQLDHKLSIVPSHFVRTTDPMHKAIVREFLQKLYDEDQIYFQEHEGFYSTRQEQFVTEKDQVNGEWPEIFGEVIKLKEPNYYFKLTQHQDWLRDYINTHPEWIVPSFRANEILGALEKPIGDLCISRPKNRLEWGIPLPFDENYVTYVWFDALVNYVSFARTSSRNWWPADLHVIGKDILIPAHAVYWPIMLKALGLEQPKQFLVHGWWMNRGAKMSKSTGNIVDPTPYVEKFGGDVFRYFVMREISLGQDADFTDEKFLQRYQSDLGNDLGNLVHRSLSMLQRYRQGVVPSYDPAAVTPPDQDLRSNQILEEFQNAMDSFQVHLALQQVWKLIQRANQYVEENAPWKLAKDPAQSARLDLVLAHLVETVRRLSILIEPFLPSTAPRLRNFLDLPAEIATLPQASFGTTLTGKTLRAPEILFPRFEEEKK
jgi:methionyl-tRNA synthetase